MEGPELHQPPGVKNSLHYRGMEVMYIGNHAFYYKVYTTTVLKPLVDKLY